MHYLANWADIKSKREILSTGRLQEYIEELIAKYPPKYIESIVDDLADEKEFYRVLSELNIVSEFEFEEADFDSPDDDEDDDIEIETRTFASHTRYEDDN